MKSGYDLPTAVTFLLAGLGLGAFFTLLVAPYPKGTLGPDPRRQDFDSFHF